MSKCKYENKYLDYNKNKYETFCCQEDQLKSGYCIFRDDKFLISNPENKKLIIEELKNKIKNCIDKHEVLICIGFHISEIKIKDNFSIPVYFNSAIFHGHVSFSESEFMDNADFSYSKFLDPVQTDFSRTKFLGKVAIFEGAEFESVNVHFNGAEFIVKEKINFMITKFKKGVDFSQTIFSTKLIAFSRAEFYGSTEFNHSNFLNFEHISFNSGSVKL